MAENSEVTGIHLGNLIESLEQVTDVAGNDINRANALEAEAASIRNAVPRNVDAAIHRATKNLMALATSRAETENSRDLLEGVLWINQHKPSRVIWSGPADINGTLDRFDKLEEGTPALLHVSNQRGQVTGVVAGKPVSVGVSVAQGMGGLPQADISFDFRELVMGRGQAARLADDAERITISDSWLRHSVIGEAAIQGYIDSAEIEVRTYPSGFCEVTNIGDLQYLAQKVSGLMAVSEAVFDTTHIEGTIEKAKNLNASERERANERAEWRRRHHIPTRYR